MSKQDKQDKQNEQTPTDTVDAALALIVESGKKIRDRGRRTLKSSAIDFRDIGRQIETIRGVHGEDGKQMTLTKFVDAYGDTLESSAGLGKTMIGRAVSYADVSSNSALESIVDDYLEHGCGAASVNERSGLVRHDLNMLDLAVVAAREVQHDPSIKPRWNRETGEFVKKDGTSPAPRGGTAPKRKPKQIKKDLKALDTFGWKDSTIDFRNMSDENMSQLTKAVKLWNEYRKVTAIAD